MNFYEALKDAPSAGCGQNFHPWLLGISNRGLWEGLPPEIIHSAIRAAIPIGRRKVTDREIQDAIKRAMLDFKGNTGRTRVSYTPPAPKPISNGPATLKKIINSSSISDEADLWESSPIRIDWEPSEDTLHFLERMFEPEKQIFIGDREEPGLVGQNIRTTKDWIDYLRRGGQTFPHIIVNPLSGESAPKKSGDGVTYRGDYCVKSFRYCLVEFDDLSREGQIRFWTSPAVRKLPVACLIDTGGKSIHGWLRLTGIDLLDAWNNEIKSKLYDQFLIPLGVDAACSNPARLSRLPGHLRGEKYQRILWMNTLEEGR